MKYLAGDGRPDVVCCLVTRVGRWFIVLVVHTAETGGSTEPPVGVLVRLSVYLLRWSGFSIRGGWRMAAGWTAVWLLPQIVVVSSFQGWSHEVWQVGQLCRCHLAIPCCLRDVSRNAALEVRLGIL